MLRAGKISAQQARESEQQQGQIPAGDIPATVSGMDALGALIMRRFPKLGIQVGRQVIQNWRRLKYVPKGCTVPFPAPSNGNRYDVQECFAWIQNYFGPRMETVGQPDPLFGETQAIKNKRELVRLRMDEREDAHQAGKLIERAISEQTITAALRRYHNLVRVQLERLDVKEIVDLCASIGLSDDQKAAIHAALLARARKTIDKVEDVCNRIGCGEDADKPDSETATAQATTTEETKT